MHLVEGRTARGRAQRAARTLTTAAAANGWDVEIVELDALRDVIEHTGRLVLCGGDGLIHRAIQVVAGRPVEVAIVPVGTGNDFARGLGIERRAAIDLAASPPGTAPVRYVDLIVADEPDGLCAAGRYAASVLTAGYSSRVNATANDMRFPPGGAKYTLAAVRELGRLRAGHLRTTVWHSTGECATVEGPFTLLAVANTPYFGGGMKICPDADASDGLLHILTVSRLSRLDLVRWLPTVFSGRHVGHPAVTVSTATAITIETAEPLRADGEPFASGGTAVTLRAAPGALRVVTR